MIWSKNLFPDLISDFARGFRHLCRKHEIQFHSILAGCGRVITVAFLARIRIGLKVLELGVKARRCTACSSLTAELGLSRATTKNRRNSANTEELRISLAPLSSFPFIKHVRLGYRCSLLFIIMIRGFGNVEFATKRLL